MRTMPKRALTCLTRVVMVMALTITCAGRASADSILLSDFQVQLDTDNMIATFIGGLEAHSSTGDTVQLDALGVTLTEGAFDGSTLLDDLPFYSLPYPLADGQIVPVSTLFRITGLTAGTDYSGSFSFFEFAADGVETLVSQNFEFSSPAPVPEPATLVLTGTGLALAFVRRRRTARRVS
jgi:hypothetical protein